jgi:hypothetical protein
MVMVEVALVVEDFGCWETLTSFFMLLPQKIGLDLDAL